MHRPAATLIASVLIFGFQALLLTAVTVAACVVFEYAYCKLVGRDVTISDLSAVVTGLLLAMSLPVTAPYWRRAGRRLCHCGGQAVLWWAGAELMNQLAGRALLCTFPGLMTTWVDALDYLPVWVRWTPSPPPPPWPPCTAARLPELDMGRCC